MSKKIDNEKLIDAAQYGKIVLQDDVTRPLIIVPKNVFDITKSLDKKGILTKWSKYYNKVFLTIYWPEKKRGLAFPFDKKQKELVKLIVKNKSLVIGNSKNNKKFLLVDVLKKEPWLKNYF